MAAETVIRAQGLGKRYIIGHQVERERYTALRDVLARNARNAARSIRDLASGRAIVGGDDREDFWALRDVGFEVNRGEVLGIVGRNGAGKSTLLKVLSRITEPSAGRVEIRGRVASLLEVGTGFHPELTGRENIFLNGAILGMGRAEIRRKFDQIVAFAEVERFLDTPVKRYSSGMYVRLAFAVAAHLEPEILVIDEVLAVGDAEFQKKCLGKMSEVAGAGRTVLFVSHNMAAVQSLCDRAIWMEHGGVADDGPVDEVLTRYLSASPDNQTNAAQVKAGPIAIANFAGAPARVRSGEPWTVSFSLEAREACRVDELAVLLFSPIEGRVGIVDLRGHGLPLGLDHTPVDVRVEIDPPPLVEGVYQLGLYVGGSAFTGNLMNLAGLDILPRAGAAGHAPYPPASRGLIDLSAKVSIGRGDTA